MSCVTITFERPAIHPESVERLVLDIFSHVFTVVFTVEMAMKVIASGLVFGKGTYFRCPWNLIDGTLAIGSLMNIVVTLMYSSNTSALRILKVFRLLRVFRPLRMVQRTPKLKLAVETLIASVKPMANLVLISSLFILVFAILGVQLFKGKFYYCVGKNLSNIKTKMDCLAAGYQWVLKEYNFDNLFQALVSLFVCYSKDGWVILMYDGLDAVGVDLQPVQNNNLWMLIYFLFFVMMSLLLLDMFIGVMVDTFHQCQRRQRREEALRPQALPPPENNENEATDHRSYSTLRRFIYLFCSNKTLDILMTVVIFLNMVLMGIEHHNQPEYVSNLRSALWNVLDIFVFLSSLVSIVLTQIQMPNTIPFNPSILRIFRALQLTQVLKAKTIKTLLKTIVKTLTQVGNISLLLFFFLFIYAALGVELFGTLECSVENPCTGLHRYSNFHNFLVTLLTLYKVCRGDNWSKVLKDTLRPCVPGDSACSYDNSWVGPIYFFTFVILVQFLIMNLIVASITQALEESRQEVNRVQLPQVDVENPPKANRPEVGGPEEDSPEEQS
ncbi:voltage-dependent T-type calcium channel subunit alpha-1H-like [Kryptolebias marmoratus]|uniref:voltage-dependent T-type calcium channel subunit alpha-1H-like n=1 Tax=Kryptolebias marmoratus TaxID=37003 RepID=UPI0018ACFEAA|nr:voltage-dependent T-type calcium channel subunit alpha-1H-like [Kryptolebias marmoratus]